MNYNLQVLQMKSKHVLVMWLPQHLHYIAEHAFSDHCGPLPTPHKYN